MKFGSSNADVVASWFIGNVGSNELKDKGTAQPLDTFEGLGTEVQTNGSKLLSARCEQTVYYKVPADERADDGNALIFGFGLHNLNDEYVTTSNTRVFGSAWLYDGPEPIHMPDLVRVS